MKKTKHEEPVSFSSLPIEIAENCLARTSRCTYPLLSTVSKSFLSLLSSPKLYTTRSLIGNTEPCIYFCLDLPDHPSPKWFALWMKNTHKIPRNIHLYLGDDDYSLGPVRCLPYPYDVPLYSTVVVGPEIYLIGGSHKSLPCSAVRILDCRSHTWRDGPNMLVARQGADAVFVDEKIYVVGGCMKDESMIEVLDIKTQTWRVSPSHGAPDLGSLWYGMNVDKGKIYAIAAKEDYIYVYDPKKGTWEVVMERHHGHVEGLWKHLVFIKAWCVIEDVIYCFISCGSFMWYDLHRRKWIKLRGLDLKLLRRHYTCGLQKRNCGFKMLNYGGELLVMWVPEYEFETDQRKRVWCARISLQKSLGVGGRDVDVWGKLEWANTVFTLPHSSKFLNCVVTSI